MDKKSFNEWVEGKEPEFFKEDSGRYSIEVNYRTSHEEVVDNYARLTLGYVSAGLKNVGYHVRNLYNEKPYRILVSTRNWDDGEWVGVLMFNSEQKTFVVARGFYNKDRKTVSIQTSHKATGKTAAELTKEMRNEIERLKKQNPRGSNTLEPVKLKPGPKPKFMAKAKTDINAPWPPYKPY